MTLQQIKLAVLAASKNSISEAAEELMMAQSNASQSVKKLEEELGFPIFRRKGNGVTPTEAGYRFLGHAEIMLREDSAIRTITAEDKTKRLRLGTTNFTAPVEAFIRFCEENRDVPNADLACVSASAEEGALRLKERSLDVVVTFFARHSNYSPEQLARDYKLKVMRIKQYPFCVRLRKDHPLIADGTLDGSIRGFMQLGKYPYVDYCCTSKLVPLYIEEGTVPFGCSYRIMVEERDTRLRITGATNAFTVGKPLPESVLNQYGLVDILINDEPMTILVLTRKGDEDLPDIAHYINLLGDELEKDW